MSIRLISNIRDGKGLARDAEVLAALCREAGHAVEVLDFRDQPQRRADLTISLEVVAPSLLCGRDWIIPNPEWWFPEYDQYLDRFQLVLCKTHDGHELFRAKTYRAEYVGFMSPDRLDASVPRERAFWHNPGGSVVKGTEAILTAWMKWQIPYPLTVCGYVVNPIPIPNVAYHRRLDDAEHKREQNRHLYHLCLSQYEGWGHYLHEALSVGAVVASTEHSPMTEFEAAFTVPIDEVGVQRLAVTGRVGAPTVRRIVEQMANMSDADADAASRRARVAYDKEIDAFRARWRALMETA